MRILARRLFWALLLALAALAPASRRAAAEEAPATPPAARPAAPPADEERRAQIRKMVDEMREEAAQIRGLAWKSRIPADLLTREQLRENLEKMVREELKPDEYDRAVRSMRRLGLLREDEDLLQLQLKFLEQGIAGYYDPKTKHLYLIDGPTGDGQRPTILHELVHALEDQYIDLEKRQKALEKDGDAMFAFKCVIEGSAEHARRAYEREHPEVAKRARAEQAGAQNMVELQKSLRATPALLVLPTLLQYQVGPAFVTRAVGADYAGGVARLWENPPKTQEQVLHPGKFLGEHKDLPRRIEWPKDLAETLGAGWKGDEAGPLGQLDFALWVDRWFSAADGRLDMAQMAQGRFMTPDAKKASEGWDGAWSQILMKDGDPLGITLVSAWDSPADAMEAGAAVEHALRKHYGDKFVEVSVEERRGSGRDGRTVKFEGMYGPGILEVAGEELRLADGFPDDTLDKVWARLSAVATARDPLDTWAPGLGPDPLAGATWGVPALGVGWKAPSDAWKAETRAGEATLAKGALKVDAWTRKGTLQQNLLPLLVDIKRRYPTAPVGPEALAGIEEVSVGGKEAARIGLDDGPRVEEGRGRAAWIVPVKDGEGLLVVVAHAPRDAWDAARKDVEAALDAFVFD